MSGMQSVPAAITAVAFYSNPTSTVLPKKIHLFDVDFHVLLGIQKATRASG